MIFCYIRDLDIPRFVGMVENSRRLVSGISYDDYYLYVSEDLTSTERGALDRFIWPRAKGD